MPVAAQDITPLEKIGPVVSFTKTEKTVVFNCQDNSQVEVSILASDLVRVRASFAKPIPAKDHSWAIEKTEWPTPRWSLTETSEAVVITTDELEVLIHRSPLLIEFRNAKTHAVINADQQPMAYDAKALLKEMLFDPRGTFVAAAKKLGFDEHFYGLGEKAARLDKRRSSFINWNSDTPGYLEGRDPIYQTVPFYTGLAGGNAYGIFFDNSYRSYFDFGKSSQQRVWFGAEGGELNYYFFYGPSLKKILNRYADLTGHMPLPPLWALGYHQCRWGYRTERDFRAVAVAAQTITVSPGLMVRQESRVSMKNGAMQSARGIWRSVKALQGCSVRSCGRRRASSKSGFMNRSGPSGHRSLRLKPSGFRSVKLGIGACGPIYERPSHRKSRWALSATVGFVLPGRHIICSIIAITIRRRACARQGCLSQCGEP